MRDVGFAGGILAILAVLFVPIPTFLIDFGLAMSIALSILILMVALWIQKPLDFSAFPTVLLITTILRLSLGIATTRLILSHGDQGVYAAGHIIQGFSRFVMSGDFVIGIVVFLILVTVNFVVITKGATRIAEVGARFTLDAIPGKQMAIDADLVGRPHRRQGSAAPPPRAGRGKRLLRLDGRRLQIRARRGHREPHRHRRQHFRRHRHRRHPPRDGARRRGRHLHPPFGRRRTRCADSGAGRLARRGPARFQGRHARTRRNAPSSASSAPTRARCSSPRS